MISAPRLTTIAGTKVAFTGTLSTARRHVVPRVRRAGGTPIDEVTSTTDILVQGAPSPAYKWGDIGVKLARVEDERERGRLVYVLSEAELDRLLSGKALSAAASRAAASGATSIGGIAHRRRNRSGRSGGRATLDVDVDERDRRLQEHQDIIEQLADALERAGYEPLDPFSADCAYDLAWQRGTTLHVAEVKTTTPASETQQIRLGLGQVLEYRTTLVAQGWKVRAHLVVTHAPTAHRAVAACTAAGVTVHSKDQLRPLVRGN